MKYTDIPSARGISEAEIIVATGVVVEFTAYCGAMQGG